MIERIFPAKNGFTVYAGETAEGTAGKTALHSRYDPALEAERYIASLGIKKTFSCFVLIEPGLGYLAAELRKRFPGSLVVCLHCSAFFAAPGRERPSAGVPETISFPGADFPQWTPASSKTLEDFLEETITGMDAAGIKLIEWKPAAAAYGTKYLELTERTVRCIRRINATMTTVRYFGRRWVHNALRNLGLFTAGAELKPGNQPVLVCSSGPGLEQLLPALAEWKAGPSPPLVVSVSSALPALYRGGIAPDLVAASDGGNWAAFHLTEGCRCRKAASLPAGCPPEAVPLRTPVLAAALSAALPSSLERIPAFFLCDGSLWQTLLLRSAAIPFLNFPQRGTVSATALDLAFFASNGAVYIAGLDLSHRDLLTHARPHAFDWFMERGSSRFRPRYFRNFERAFSITQSGSHRIYADWFRSGRGSFPERLYALGGTDNGTRGGAESGTGIPVVSIPRKGGEPGAGKRKPALFTFQEPLRTEKDSLSRGKALLLEALSGPGARQLEKELGELLAPDTAAEDLSRVLPKILEDL